MICHNDYDAAPDFLEQYLNLEGLESICVKIKDENKTFVNFPTWEDATGH